MKRKYFWILYLVILVIFFAPRLIRLNMESKFETLILNHYTSNEKDVNVIKLNVLKFERTDDLDGDYLVHYYLKVDDENSVGLIRSLRFNTEYQIVD